MPNSGDGRRCDDGLTGELKFVSWQSCVGRKWTPDLAKGGNVQSVALHPGAVLLHFHTR
jgi:hypothetical protein